MATQTTAEQTVQTVESNEVNAANYPRNVVFISNAYPETRKGVDGISFEFRKIIPNQKMESVFSTSFQLQGMGSYTEKEELNLVATKFYTLQALEMMKTKFKIEWKVGDVLTKQNVGTEHFDLIRFETNKLSRDYGLDAEGKVVAEPVKNGENGFDFLLDKDNKLIFSFTDLFAVGSAADLEKVREMFPVKLERSLTKERISSHFTTDTAYDTSSGKRKKTEEYIEFINSAYQEINLGKIAQVNQ